MELFFLIVGIIVFCILKKLVRNENNYLEGYPPRNLPLQYAYTIDEWYRLRCEFDKEIEPDWEKYRNNEIDRMEYRQACLAAVKRIIPREYYDKFQTLYRWGCRCAAIKVIEEGYTPGMMDYAQITRREFPSWRPKEYIVGTPYNRGSWMRCIPERHSFLDMYPYGQILDYMGCGRMRETGWTTEYREDAWCNSYYSNNGARYNPADRHKAIDYFQQRGFDGYKYQGEPERNFGDLTKEEIKKKYEFLQHRPDMMRDDYDASCKRIINQSHYELASYKSIFLFKTIE